MDSYFKIARPGEAKVTEKMSRFLAFAVPINDAEEARTHIKRIQNDYHDARHVCWAYMLGAQMADFQLNDNGEPSGTAGKPILGQIRSHGVTDVLVAVVRYFGGIKLGTSGLIAAYRQAASDALDDAGRMEVHQMIGACVEVPYITLDNIMRIIKVEEDRMTLKVIERVFNNVCLFRLSLRADFADEILGKMRATEGAIVKREDQS